MFSNSMQSEPEKQTGIYARKDRPERCANALFP